MNLNNNNNKMIKFAIAIYDNEAESDEELSFKKNDLLQVDKIDFMGMEGWWLCKLIKDNKTGLAPGNRLKITNDIKLISKLKNNIVLTNLNKNVSNKSNPILSSSNSSSSSSSSLSLTSNNQSSHESTLNSRLQALSLQPDESPKIVLPAKLKTKANSVLKFDSNSINLTESTENILNLKSNLRKNTINENDNENNILVENNTNENDDDYDYDIPENNKPTPKLAKLLLKSEQECLKLENDSRKSISPTIDSGISTSSLMSLNSDNLLNQSCSSSTINHRISDLIYDEVPRTKQNQGIVDFEEKMDKFQLYFNSFNTTNVKDLSQFLILKEAILELKQFLHDFLLINLKPLKHEHACFHPDLNTFNKFKSLYRQIKDFYLYIESNLNTYEKVLKWNFDLIILNENNKNDFIDLISNKISHCKSLIDQLRQLVNEKQLFDYHSESSSYEVPTKSKDNEIEQNFGTYDYQYEYDNSNFKYEDKNVDYLPEADYCEIDDDGLIKEEEAEINFKTNSEKLEKLVEKVSNNSSLCMTLKRNDEMIRREIRLATSSNNNEKTRITMSDQMLLKFYLRHIEENFNDLKTIYDILVENLNKNVYYDVSNLNDLANKLALNGHKIVFICDTLQRNINNANLKISLFDSSNILCDSLKLYMIRIKSLSTDQITEKQNKLILDSLDNVLSSADKFKQIVLKYFFNNY